MTQPGILKGNIPFVVHKCHILKTMIHRCRMEDNTQQGGCHKAAWY